MSIPDNPFQATTTPPSGPSIAPALQIDLSEPSDAGHNPAAPTGGTPTGSPQPGTHASPSGSVSPRPAIGGLMPPGGHNGGAKTPRRVQWTSNPHIVQIHSPEGSGPPSPQTLDASNIDEFRDALERHRSGATGGIGGGALGVGATGGMGMSGRRRPPSQLSRQSSATDSVTRQGTDDEEDYDYRNDVDPPQRPSLERNDSENSGGNFEVNLIDNGMRGVVPQYIAPGETDGLPNIPQPQQSASNQQDETDAARDLVRAHTGKWGVLRRRVRGAGTAKNAFRIAAEGEGKNGRDAEKNGGDGADESRQSQDAFAARYPEPRRPSHAMMGGQGAPAGASVLSSLLALYGQQGDGAHSGTTSAASSRRGSEDEYSSDEEMKKIRGSRHGWRHITRRPSEAPPGPEEVVVHDEPHPANVAAAAAAAASPTSPTFPNSPQSSSFPSGAPNTAPGGGDGPVQPLPSRHSQTGSGSGFDRYERRPGSPGIVSIFQKAKETLQYSRPDTAKSGAGVFGALIQNTQNLSGAATPAASTLAPAAKRPGYQLTRYSLPDVNTETRGDGQPASKKNAPWRPPSRPGSRAGSRPGSIHSSTAVSRDGESPKDDNQSFGGKKAISSDDLIGMRHADDSTLSLKKKNRPKSGLNLDSLAHFPVAAMKGTGKGVKNAEKWLLGGRTPNGGTPPEKGGMDYFSRPLTEEERRRKEWEAEKKKRKKAREARKKQEIFIIQHVAAILARQQFLMKLARALMMFGSPSHRLETQIQATAKVLEINCQVVYLPGTMLISFGDDATHTSETKFLKQSTGLDLGKLQATHHLYWNVVHDKMSVDQASKDLDVLMTTPVYYTWWQTMIIGGVAPAFIVVMSFYGSFADALMCIPLGSLLVAVQMLAARNDMFSNVFEITVATLISFISAALASTHVFCYTALVSGGVVLILPGYIVLSGALELASRNITAGAVRIGYSVIYSLFLGFGISMGAVLYAKITSQDVLNANNYTCSNTHYDGAPWWQSTPSGYWYFLCAPGFSLGLSLRNQQPLWAIELPIMVLISCAGWTCNHFSSLAFPGRSDITSAIGSFVVGTLGSIYGRFSNGSSFPVTVPGILIQLPSGLSNGGIFNFASESASGSSTAYSDGFSVAEQLVSVAIGLTVGLFVSAAVCHPLGGGRRRGSGIFSF
ncbi:hypothetical protein IAT38_005114 [Cryptococcus sp. DSM 104549]